MDYCWYAREFLSNIQVYTFSSVEFPFGMGQVFDTVEAAIGTSSSTPLARLPIVVNVEAVGYVSESSTCSET